MTSFGQAAFVGIGAAQSAYVMGSTNIVMEYGHSHDVPMRMALSNTAEGAVGALAPLVGSEFVPQTDQGFTQLAITMPVGASLERTDTKVRQIEQIVLDLLRERGADL